MKNAWNVKMWKNTFLLMWYCTLCTLKYVRRYALFIYVSARKCQQLKKKKRKIIMTLWFSEIHFVVPVIFTIKSTSKCLISYYSMTHTHHITCIHIILLKITMKWMINYLSNYKHCHLCENSVMLDVHSW